MYTHMYTYTRIIVYYSYRGSRREVGENHHDIMIFCGFTTTTRKTKRQVSVFPF